MIASARRSRGEAPSGGGRAEARVSANEVSRLADPGAARNTLLQLMSNMAGVVFTAGLTLFLVRALGASGYGHYALAINIAALLVIPTGLGLPMSVGRYLADHRSDPGQLRAILLLGLRLQVPAGLIAAIALFVAAGPVAGAYGDPHLAWPLRWVALSVMGQALFGFLIVAGTALRQSGISLRLALLESASETSSSIMLVVLGGGAAGAVLGKSIGYAIAVTAGIYLLVRMLGRIGGPERARSQVGPREVLGYAGATFIVDLGWTLIARIDILLIGALLTSAAVGRFNAVLRILTVLGYLGVAVSQGVAPRLSAGGGTPDVRAFSQGLRYLLIVQGLVLAPMIVWSKPLVDLLLGHGFGQSAPVMQVLSVAAFVSAPAALLSVSINYLGAARRRVKIIAVTLVLGIIATYVLIDKKGLIGAAVADDLVSAVYVVATLWLCARLIAIDLESLVVSVTRILIAAAAMSLVLLIVGTDHLSPAQWLVGAAAGAAAYAGVLLITREISIVELRAVTARLSTAARPARG
jgi:O-antigen/teichoic acid export membrane protein